MAALIFPTVVMLAALVVFSLAVAWVRHSPLIGLALLCLLIVPLWEVPHLPAILTLSGMSVYPADVITPVLFTVGLLEIAQLRENLRGWVVPWVFFGVLIAIATLRGVLAYELAATINEARPFLYFFWAMTWVMGVRPDRFRLQTVSLILGWVLVLVAVYHGVTYGVGGSSSLIATADGFGQTGRVLVAPQAMALLLCAATVSLGPSSRARNRAQLYVISSIVFAGVVIIAQHRSVWGAGALGLTAVLIWSGQVRTRNQVFLLSILVAWAALVGWSSGILEQSQFADSASNTSTYEWRSSSWQILISQAIDRGPMTMVSGEPFGSNASVRKLATTGNSTAVQAHNWYVTIFLYLGILGLITFVSMLVWTLVKSRGMSSVWTFVPAAVAAFSWAYSLEWLLTPWLGIAMSMTLGAGHTEAGPIHESGPLADPCAAKLARS